MHKLFDKIKHYKTTIDGLNEKPSQPVKYLWATFVT